MTLEDDTVTIARPSADPRLGRRAMIMAAGLGRRMLPLTEDRPKPLVEVGGRPLIAYSLDRIAQAGVERAVVNVHYCADQIEAFLGGVGQPDIVVSNERDRLLDTGGGIVRALPELGEDPFFILNSDAIWIEGAEPALERLRARWDEDAMDCLMLLAATATSIGYTGYGDFHMDPDGRLFRRGEGEVAPFTFAGAYLVHPRLFAGMAEEPFSMNLLWDRAAARGRLYGLRHDGVWLHVGTPDAIAAAETALKDL
ncbi:nucleotidyltransferase family protein [Kaustia mangrovi]|uniref:Nucleotidyltransferase family protein n=2 Tax=Kaustia mangrovi TaxID=2593653 RepID=A0A7S8C3A7_9HYPH|nr:nucleotidyltransferase family protein [Kaustia mangrovi]